MKLFVRLYVEGKGISHQQCLIADERFYPHSVSVEDFDSCVANVVALRPKKAAYILAASASGEQVIKLEYYTWVGRCMLKSA